MHDIFYAYTNICRFSTMDLNYNFFPSNLQLHSHDMCFVNVFDSCINVIMLNMLIFKSSVLFGTHNLLGKSLRVLELPTHLSNLTESG